MIELLLVFGGFKRKKQARSVPEYDGFPDAQCFCGHWRPSVLCGETAQSTFPSEGLQPPHIGCELNQSNHDCPSFGSGKCLLKRRTRGPPWLSKPRSTHMGQLVGPGEVPSWVSARPDEFKVQTRHFYCENYTENLLKVFFSIHAIFDSRYWNSVKRYLLKVSNVILEFRQLRSFKTWRFCHYTSVVFSWLGGLLSRLLQRARASKNGWFKNVQAKKPCCNKNMPG